MLSKSGSSRSIHSKAAEVRRAGSPVAIYAQKSSATHRSKRPVDTVAPLARALKLEVIAVDHERYKRMVKEILSNPRYDRKTVLICWEHNAITQLAKVFGVKDAPKFPGVYDRTWIITFSAKGKARLTDLPQRLLPGDSKR